MNDREMRESAERIFSEMLGREGGGSSQILNAVRELLRKMELHKSNMGQRVTTNTTNKETTK